MDIDNIKFNFEYKEGKLYWRHSRGKKTKAGDRAGHLQQTGYWAINLDKKLYKEHRVIFMIHHGYLPRYIDHIDGNKLNNKIENLRSCTNSENAMNSKISSRNSLGIKNVSFHKVLKKYKVQIQLDGKDIHIGYFEDLKIAEIEAQKARQKYFGDFSRTI